MAYEPPYSGPPSYVGTHYKPLPVMQADKIQQIISHDARLVSHVIRETVHVVIKNAQIIQSSR